MVAERLWSSFLATSASGFDQTGLHCIRYAERMTSAWENSMANPVTPATDDLDNASVEALESAVTLLGFDLEVARQVYEIFKEDHRVVYRDMLISMIRNPDPDDE